MTDSLVAAIQNKQALLFVGAGVSAGLDVPTWSELIAHIGNELGYDPEIFASPGSNYLKLAEFYKITKGSIGPLRSWMDTNWNAPDDELKKSKVHELIVELDFPIIYTTNYDRNIENAYRVFGRDAAKIIDVRDILPASSSQTQIIKLHGDFENDESIVLTETDYFDRLSFESPLDIKLRSDALAKTILFIGYSLSDINVRLLLHKMWKTWAKSGHEKHRPQSYVFFPKPDPIDETVLRQWNVKAVVGDDDDPGASLCKFLESLIKN